MQYVEDLTSPTGGDRNKADQKIMPLKEGSEQIRPKNKITVIIPKTDQLINPQSLTNLICIGIANNT